MVTQAKLIRSIGREDYSFFFREFWHTVIPEPLIWNWTLQVMCDELQKVCKRIAQGLPKEYDLLTNIPTGCSKSLSHSVFLTPWFWTFMPHACVLGASYADQLALDLGTKARDVVKSEKYQACFPEVQIREDRDAKGFFMNTHGGMRYSCGAGAAVHGLHFHLQVIDDAIDPLKVLSEVEMYKVNYWINNTLSGRKKDKRVTVQAMVAQRLHQNDPPAEMLKRKNIRHIRIPATDEFPIHPPELKEYYKDGLMDPVRLPKTVLDDERRILGPAGFAGQYGQNPIALEGGAFNVKMLRVDKVPDRFVRIARAWDKAVTPERGSSLLKGAAFTAGVLIGVDAEERVWILDVIRKRLDSFARERLIHSTAQKDGEGVPVGIEQEPGSGGEDSALATVRRLAGFRVQVFRASGSKESRADAFSSDVNAGIVYIPEQFRQGTDWVGWAKEFVEEMQYFPFSTFKDQIDAASIAHKMVRKRRIKIGAIGPRRKPAMMSLAVG